MKSAEGFNSIVVLLWKYLVLFNNFFLYYILLSGACMVRLNAFFLCCYLGMKQQLHHPFVYLFPGSECELVMWTECFEFVIWQEEMFEWLELVTLWEWKRRRRFYCHWFFLYPHQTCSSWIVGAFVVHLEYRYFCIVCEPKIKQCVWCLWLIEMCMSPLFP